MVRLRDLEAGHEVVSVDAEPTAGHPLGLLQDPEGHPAPSPLEVIEGRSLRSVLVELPGEHWVRLEAVEAVLDELANPDAVVQELGFEHRVERHHLVRPGQLGLRDVDEPVAVVVQDGLLGWLEVAEVVQEV